MSKRNVAIASVALVATGAWHPVVHRDDRSSNVVTQVGVAGDAWNVDYCALAVVGGGSEWVARSESGFSIVELHNAKGQVIASKRLLSDRAETDLSWRIFSGADIPMNIPDTALIIKRRTALGRRLQEIRDKIVAAGAADLDWDGVELERDFRRGETG